MLPAFVRRLLSMPERIESEPIQLGQRRVYVMPTRQGLAFGVCLAVMLLGAVNYALSLAYMLTFLLAAVGLVTILHTFRNLAWISVRAAPVQPVFAGEDADFTLLLENTARRDRYAVRLTLGDASTMTDLPRQSIARATVSTPALRRGWQSAGAFTLETRYPLGLFRAWAVLRPASRVLVYPRPRYGERPATSVDAHEGTSNLRGPGQDDMADLRPYRAGDAPGLVAWKSLARSDTLFTRVLDAAQTRQSWVDWDALSPELGLEDRLEILTGWILDLHESDIAFGLRIPGTVITPGSGADHAARCLACLALFGGEPPNTR
jgi:uncharacterized protein (DUF58 family)